MAYSSGYDAYSDPYASRSLSRSLSRRQSMGYPSTPYPHQMYPDGMTGSDYQAPYQTYGAPSSSVVPMSHRLASQAGYDYEEPYYDGGRQMSSMSHGTSMSHGGYSSSMVAPRSRRHSTVSFAAPPAIDPYRSPSAIHLKFKRKGSFTSGIGLDEAQQRIRLSGHDSHTFHDLHADGRGRIYLKWAGYSSLTYEIPLDGYDSRINLETLARRVSRACVHYLQANVIPIVWDRVVLHHLEEISYGVWQPMLSTR
ncbi:hypothetical protein HYPSUDRAFT_60974 [Hypholoma sublateritium FD-334 SS-4]|uniref:DUF6741 domain-containing protein n=1 Tax=Hypholoma sublateritium (strain FD-334 SS-4) TaxID=945553 RepID=A0A0D2PH27_HYPSF|nr:hypothetical protein HYPSUDRAFT_60974 [Hypholoma sublateritium FD-334 SS-4]